LHGDAISLDTPDGDKVVFKPFMGIAPSRYRDLFEKGKRKLATGEAAKWQSDPMRPLIYYISSPSADAETWVVGKLTEILAGKS
jgi:cytidine deaminase